MSQHILDPELLPENTQIFQRMDGGSTILYSNGTKRILFPGGGEKIIFPDGGIMVLYPDGVIQNITPQGKEELTKLP